MYPQIRRSDSLWGRCLLRVICSIATWKSSTSHTCTTLSATGGPKRSRECAATRCTSR